MDADMDEEQRCLVRREFRAGAARFLLSTDHVTHGIDPRDPLVISYDLPASVEMYLHRVGRLRQLGHRAVAISFVTAQSVHMLRDIERFYSTQIEELPMDFADFL